MEEIPQKIRTTKEAAFKHYLEWRKLPKYERILVTKSDFAHQYGMTLRTLEQWDERIDNPISKRKIEKYDSESFLKDRTLEIDEALIQSCIKGSPKALELFYKLTGRKLIDKSEVDVKLGLSADEVIRRLLNAEREARELNNGDNEMSGKSEVLHDKLLSSPRQRGAGDNPLATLATPDNTIGLDTEVARPDTSEETSLPGGI